MPTTVYILYSPSRKQFYVGASINLKKRILQHNNRESSFTASGVPWHILWLTNKPTKLKAENLEKKLKNLSKKRKVDFIKKHIKGQYNIDLLYSSKVE